jgi:hypothetical protein
VLPVGATVAAGAVVGAGIAVAAGGIAVGASVGAVPQADRTVAVIISIATRLYQFFLDMMFFSFS